MTQKSPGSKTLLAAVALESVPPSIQAELLADNDFVGQYEINTKNVISFGSSGHSFQRSVLFNKVRALLDSDEPVNIEDADGCVWSVEKDSSSEGGPTLVASGNGKRLVLPNFGTLSQDVEIRIKAFEELTADVNLPVGDCQEWRNILLERPLTDDEESFLQEDIQDTPVYVERHVRDEMQKGRSSISSLVPRSRRYYERLVGKYDGSETITDYAAGSGGELLKELIQPNSLAGMVHALLLSSHSSLIEAMPVEQLDADDLISVYEYVDQQGDLLACLGAIEVGFRLLPRYPEITPHILGLVHSIRDDDLHDNRNNFALFSSLFVFVDGEIARLRLHIDKPPFYRRLVSLAQAALIHRQIIQSAFDYEEFADWAYTQRGEHFYFQSLVDMRKEPRWSPDLVEASQFQQEFFGRVINASRRYEEHIVDVELRELALSTDPKSILAISDGLRPYYSGPLEGVGDCPNPLPEEIERTIDSQLDEEKVDFSSFIALVNSAMVFRVTQEQAELAAKKLTMGNYRLTNVGTKEQLLRLLRGLATVAAVTRSTNLANEVRILMRIYLRDLEFNIPTDQAFWIGLVAAASYSNLKQWREYVGEWVTELAFGDLDQHMAEVVHSHLTVLLQIVPELWAQCAKADAALKAILG